MATKKPASNRAPKAGKPMPPRTQNPATVLAQLQQRQSGRNFPTGTRQPLPRGMGGTTP